MNETWTKQEIANKIDWEGGLDETLRWGLKIDHMPDQELRLAFSDAFNAFREFEAAGDRFMELLPEPGEEEGGGDEQGHED